ncbi:adenylate/guanylate cyclase domain-containing protein [Aeromicrobium sp. NPDC092404]|uniref:adenylate/guanylate cyclase domain-containing protein n=1 Tax=Aeromicrobium sp. NPDC092404 TaxID=3154976 RepID=UPI0034464EBF
MADRNDEGALPGAPADDPADTPAFDPALLIDVAEAYLFDEPASLTQAQVAEAAGVDLDTANAMWRHLGFSERADDEVAFTPADVEALRITQRLTELGIVEPERMPQFVRSMGRSFSRLADWQTRVLLSSLAEKDGLDDPPLEVLVEVIPMVEQVQGYIWRRHLLATASRMALRGVSDRSTVSTAVGFVDIVGYTSRSRQMTTRALGDMVEWFERVTTDLVVAHGGQVVKTIGDEVLYTVDDPVRAGHLALSLAERSQSDERFPEVRVGTAHGPVLARLGDVFGATVNLAARLTSIARPGRVLADGELAKLLQAHPEEFRLRRTRRTSVKGYEHLEPWSVKRPRESRD